MPARRGAQRDRGGHRLFVAVDPPPAVAAEVSGWARAQREPGSGLRVMPGDRIHLTLAFLGEQAAVDVDPIARALAGAVGEWTLAGGRGPVPLELGPPAWLPPRRPRALAVEVRDPSGQLSALRGAVGSGLRDAVGWSADERPFRPHLTAARRSGREEVLTPLTPTPSVTFSVDTAVLYRSFLDPGGARYEVLERVPLC